MSKKKVVIINGSGGVGKDTFIDMIGKFAKVVNYSSVDVVKKLAKGAGWEGEKTEKARKFLSDLKRITTEYNDLSFRCTLGIVNAFFKADDDDEILFIHVREPEEIDRLKNVILDALHVNALTLLITRASVQVIESNVSDRNVANYEYDFYCKNDGSFHDLANAAKKFLESIRNNN